MELSESDPISVSISNEESGLGFEPTSSITSLNSDVNSRPSSELDHAADTCDSLHKELQTKFKLNENGDEQEKGELEAKNDLKVSTFTVGFGEKPQDKGEVLDYVGDETTNWNRYEKKVAEYGGVAEYVNEKDRGSNIGERYQYPLIHGGEILNYEADHSGWVEYEYSGWNETTNLEGDDKRKVAEYGEDSGAAENVDEKDKESHIGAKYYGGNVPDSGLNCSGLVEYEYSDWNKTTNWEGADNERKVAEYGEDGVENVYEKDKRSNSESSYCYGVEAPQYELDHSGLIVYAECDWNATANCEGNDNERKVVEYGELGVVGENVEYKRSNIGVVHHYPVRPEAEDCAFYMRNGTCKFGSNCKFNHPKRKNQTTFKVYNNKVRGREESTERSSQIECKYYLTSGGCKYGNACRYNHSGINSSPAPGVELNFLGLPIRLGEKECPYYMRNGSCKYGAACKFNHPDPTTVVGGDSPSRHGNGGSVPLQAINQSSLPSWSPPVTPNGTYPFVPFMPVANQGVSSQSLEWDGYQHPLYVPERIIHPPSPYGTGSPALQYSAYGNQQLQMQVEEYPERPGEMDCSYFLKTGDCKFKSNCKFHHPKNWVARAPSCTLSDKGLPLRPDQNVCTHYSRYGICKFGPVCKFDHPIQPTSSVMLAPEQHYSFTNSTASEGAEVFRAGGGNNAIVQQSV